MAARVVIIGVCRRGRDTDADDAKVTFRRVRAYVLHGPVVVSGLVKIIRTATSPGRGDFLAQHGAGFRLAAVAGQVIRLCEA